MSRHSVTIFSSIPSVIESLQTSVTLRLSTSTSTSPVPTLQVLTDASLRLCGGTVSFDPTKLEASTLETLSETEILISEPRVVADLLRAHPSALPKLQWLQSTFAGVDPLVRLFASTSTSTLPSTVPSWRLTRFAGKFGPPIAEWCLARIVGHERSFASTAHDQTLKVWAGSSEVNSYRYLSSLTLTILGCGDIGHCIARAAQVFGMNVVGYVRSPRQETDATTKTTTTTMTTTSILRYTTNLTEALQAGDYVVSVLPSTAETRGLLSLDVLSMCAKANGGQGPVFLNVGRGDVVAEPDVVVVEALDRGYLSAAILDVMETEPLPPTSPLWDHPKVTVSPHVSGLTQARDVPDVFWKNYQRFVDGEPLGYEVDWDKGY